MLKGTRLKLPSSRISFVCRIASSRSPTCKNRRLLSTFNIGEIWDDQKSFNFWRTLNVSCTSLSQNVDNFAQKMTQVLGQERGRCSVGRILTSIRFIRIRSCSNKRFTLRCTINVYTFTECVYYGDRDSIEHSLIECMFTRLFTQKVLNWFNQVNACQISPTTGETLFCITTSSHDTTIIRKFNYTALFMCHYIYSAKLNSLAISFQDFISKLLIKYKLENLP